MRCVPSAPTSKSCGQPLWARFGSTFGLLSGEPLTLPYYRSRVLRRWVSRTLAENRIDAAVVFSSAMAQYLDGFPPQRLLVDFVDVDSAKWSQYAATRPWPQSWIYGREGQRLLAYEGSVARRAAHSFFATDKEAALFRQAAPDCGASVDTLSNGVDAEYFSPDAAIASPFRADELPIVFTGAMDYWPNVDAVLWFAHEVLASSCGRSGRPHASTSSAGIRRRRCCPSPAKAST